VEAIPNGVEKIEYDARATARHLLFVGRLDLTEKGGDLLFEIFVRIHRLRGRGAPQLVIVGDGPDRKAMERLAQKSGLSHLVEFRGRVEGVEKYRLMSEAHAVLMPSRYETFGLVGVESLAAGAPLIAFDVGPLREVVGDSAGARLIRPWDLDAFAQEVLRFVDDRELRERVRERGRHWARRYDWDEISLRQEEFYLRTLRERQNFEPAAGSPKRTAGSIRKQLWRQRLSGSSWQLGNSSYLSSGEAALAGASRLIGKSAAGCLNLTLIHCTKQRGPEIGHG
jgi:glycosyltransferase involved in cell wall biosynthesis